MAWGEVKVEEQRKLFIDAYLSGKFKMANLCRQFKISRPKGYKWLNRFKKHGYEGLKDRSRARRTQKKTAQDIEQDILKTKFHYSDWGPKKIYGYLEKNHPTIHWPSSTTIGNIFKKNGLTKSRKCRKLLQERTAPLSHSQQCNDVWCMDFKGWFISKDGKKCEPFTLTDAHSRYLLRCLDLAFNDVNHVWAVFESVFQEYGLPKYIRSDNGPPFGTCGAGRLSQLSVRLIKAGVIPEWIDPGKPQQNGRHERMHGTLKRECISKDFNLDEQKLKIHEFQHYYNFIRPHEALDQNTPGSVYIPSNRRWDGKLRSPEYPKGYKVAKAASCGKICLKGKLIYIGRAVAREPIGLIECENGLSAYFGPIFLGTLIENELVIPRRKLRKKHLNRLKEEGIL